MSKMTISPRLITLLATAALAAGALAACTSDNATGPSQQDVSEATGNAPTRTISQAPAEPEGDQVAAIDAKSIFTTNCGSCHTLKAAGTNGNIGPNLDTSLAASDGVDAITEMIVEPNKEIVKGYKAGIMPVDFGKTLSAEEIKALAELIDENAHGAA
ncbi:unannotated protein [freshwater metagenome]|uniref:Unannotated protein n=1 Tax=freshwater metagenome TaxID=449393 RepID=A0A6J7IKE5_9ZZZZ